MYKLLFAFDITLSWEKHFAEIHFHIADFLSNLKPFNSYFILPPNTKKSANFAQNIFYLQTLQNPTLLLK